jgi:hypothetical protein
MRADLSEVERARRLHTLGVVGVVTLWLPIFFWMLHLSTLAALIPYLNNNPSKWWLAWIDTGVFAAGTIACILAGIWVGASVNASEEVGDGEGRNRFIAWQVVLAGLANLALILTEGSYVLFLSPMHR